MSRTVKVEYTEIAVDKLIADNKKSQEKRQPIKQQTLDEFNITRSVSYGVYIKTEPLTDK